MFTKKIFALVVTSLLFLGSLIGAATSSGHSIIFVHLGDTIPSYMEIAIKQARLFNDCPILLVANQKALDEIGSALDKYETTTIACESLVKTKEHHTFLTTSKLDKRFRNGFWSYATERFFYLQDLMQQYTLENVVHLENDVMLYVELETIMPTLKKHYPHLGLTLDNDNRCIPGFVYIADSKSMDHLAQHVATAVASGKNDMESLAGYCQKFGLSFANQLPIIMSSYANMNKLRSPCGFVAKNKQNYSLYEEEFTSIFDAAALGQYLGGIDPRNDPKAKPGFINESCVFNPSLLAYTWKKDEKGRAVPYASYKDSEVRINNLHIHSKNLQAFLSVKEV